MNFRTAALTLSATTFLAFALIACERPNPTAAPAALSSSESGVYTFSLGYPSEESAQRALDDSDINRAVQAYRFWYPTVSAEGIFQGNRDIGIQDNVGGIVTAAGPRLVAFTANSDTPYACATLDVSQGPMVIEIPAGPYIGLVDDHNQTWVADLGIPGPNAGKGDKIVILPPGFKDREPRGFKAYRTETYKQLLAIRALPVNGDQQGAIDALTKIKVYPLNAPTKLLAWTNTTDKKADATSLRWEDNIQFWQVLAKIVSEEPVSSRYPAMAGMLSAIGIQKGKPFQPDGRMTSILKITARAGRDRMLVSAFASARPDRLAWPDRKWEWVGLVPNTTQFETPMGLDLEARERWFIQAIVTSPAMFRRTEGAGSLYWLGNRDTSGAFLDGGKSYKLTVPQPVPNKLFWSVTAYDAQTRSEVQTDQDKAALRSMFELKDVSTSQPTELYFGPTAPPGHEGQWIKTAPGRGWFAYFRIYGPEKPAFDGSWKPGDFEEIK
jgi:hypothetical protein